MSTKEKESKVKEKESKVKEKDSKGKVKAKKDAAKDLKELFVDSLKDIYWAEKALTKALPKMMKNATTPKLKDAIENHLSETKGQIERLENVFEMIGEKAKAKKCDAMEGLLKEAEGIMEETESGNVRDAGIIAASQKVEHYEIATYGTLVSWANDLGIDDVIKTLEETLNEEKSADKKLAKLANSGINKSAKK